MARVISSSAAFAKRLDALTVVVQVIKNRPPPSSIKREGNRMELKFEPWVTPNFARMQIPARRRQEGFQESPAFTLKELDADELARMCDEFRREVFRKAEKQDPALASHLSQGAKQ